MNNKKSIRAWLGGLLVAASMNTWADPDVQTAHWAYSSFFGTGWYRVEGNRSVFVLRLPPRQTLQTSEISASGERALGMEIHYPVTLGLHNIDAIENIAEPDNFATVSFTPGFEMEIPVSQNFHLRPYINVGYGVDFDNDDSAWIWHTGLKARYRFEGGGLDWALLGSVHYTGYNPKIGRSNKIGGFMAGIEMEDELGMKFFGNEMNLRLHFNYQRLNDELEYIDDLGRETVNDVFELGIAWAYRKGPIKVAFFNIQQIGLGYQVSPEGDFTAVKLNMRSWFTR